MHVNSHLLSHGIPYEFSDILCNDAEAWTVLVVEDEQALNHLLCRSVEREGFQAIAAADGRSALDAIHHGNIKLVLLDVRLPKMDGYTVCSKIRQMTDVPIIMLSAMSRTDDVVRGLEAGADDYVVKPFSFKDLMARIYALLRRTHWSKNRHLFEHSVVRLQRESQGVLIGDRLVKLTPTEFKLLDMLSQSAEETVSFKKLMMGVWGYQPKGKAAILHTNIRRLREKIEDDPADPVHIVTVARFGYKFIPCSVPPVAQPATIGKSNDMPSAPHAVLSGESRTPANTARCTVANR